MLQKKLLTSNYFTDMEYLQNTQLIVDPEMFSRPWKVTSEDKSSDLFASACAEFNLYFKKIR